MIQNSTKSGRLPIFVFILVVLQPLLDIVSYFWVVTGRSNLVTLGLRMGLLAVTAVLAFLISDRKRVYLITAGICAAFWAIHMAVHFQLGYQDAFSDLANYIRVVQIVVYTLCFITFLRHDARAYRSILLGFCVNFAICLAVMVISTVTGTDPHTYVKQSVGVLGWFYFANSQSAILGAMAPIVLMLTVRHQGRYHLPILLVVTAAVDAALFFNGTRLAFASLLATAVGIPVVLAITRQFHWKEAAILLLCATVCVVCYKVSPTNQNQHIYTDAMTEKQGWAEQKVQKEKEAILQEHGLSEDSPEAQALLEQDEIKIRMLTPLYEWCATNFVDRFGAETVIRRYDFSTSVQEITAVRRQKIMYCEMLLEQQPITATLFGLELADMTYQDKNYDVENDFHGIYFLYGAVGLILLCGFIGYFLLLIVKALCKDFKTYFTPMAGAIGISLIILLVFSYFTAGVLRRPNASFYLSVALALVYYLTKIKVYPSKEENCL